MVTFRAALFNQTVYASVVFIISCHLFSVVIIVIKQCIMILYNVYFTWLVAIILLLVACG